VLALALAPSAPTHAGELLENGGFEAGDSGWNGIGTTGGCTPHGGSDALQVSANGSVAFVQQNVDGPLGDGAYTLSGWVLVTAGAPEISVRILWLDGEGSEVDRSSETFSGGESYDSFSLSSSRPSTAQSMRVRIAVEGNEATVCLDDVSLDGPPAPPPTAIPTATPEPTQTPVTPASTPKASPTAKPSATAKPASTARPAATTAPSSAAPTFSFINGGFEQGLDGWRKYGGELRLVTQPAYSGAAAGELYSSTDSTKWAYQTVRIDPSKSYEFSGHVHGGAGMSRAFLRISWYASSDGSGEAISTTDSTTTLETAGTYVYLTTGSVAPPPGARTAKPRVMFTPRSAAPASIQFDELSFAVAAPPTATPAPAATNAPASAAGESARDETPRTIAGASDASPVDDEEPEGWDAEPSATPVDEVLAVVADAGPDDELLPIPLTQPSSDDGVPLLWLVGGALFAAGLGGSYLAGRRRP
jgi:hypothetical protein